MVQGVEDEDEVEGTVVGQLAGVGPAQLDVGGQLTRDRRNDVVADHGGCRERLGDEGGRLTVAGRDVGDPRARCQPVSQARHAGDPLLNERGTVHGGVDGGRRGTDVAVRRGRNAVPERTARATSSITVGTAWANRMTARKSAGNDGPRIIAVVASTSKTPSTCVAWPAATTPRSHSNVLRVSHPGPGRDLLRGPRTLDQGVQQTGAFAEREERQAVPTEEVTDQGRRLVRSVVHRRMVTHTRDVCPQSLTRRWWASISARTGSRWPAGRVRPPGS